MHADRPIQISAIVQAHIRFEPNGIGSQTNNNKKLAKHIRSSLFVTIPYLSREHTKSFECQYSTLVSQNITHTN